ncbi:MAG: hypothetical protein ACWA5U_07750 [bacterium]
MKTPFALLTTLSISLFLLLSGMSHANAKSRWIAQCMDGQNVHYVQHVNGPGYLYMEITTPEGIKRIFPMATLRQSRLSNQSICGQVLGNNDPRGKKLAQVCSNIEQKIIYMKFTSPFGNEPAEEGVFCQADVWIQE